jgi:drug/metabolite transporter (DMT)-like permease
LIAPNPRRAYGLLACVILFWGLNWPIMKTGLHYIPPIGFGAVRLVLGAALLFLLLALRREVRLPTRHDLPVVLSVAILQLLVTMTCTNLALREVGAGRAALLAYTTPLWVAPGAILWLGERLSPLKLAGLVVGLAGLVVLFNPLSFAWDQPRVLRGNGLLLLGALAWAGSILHVRGHRWESTPLQLLPWQMLLAAPALLGLSWLFERDQPILWGGPLAAVLAYNALVATAFCYWAVITVTRLLPATTTSLGLLGVPVVGILASVVFLGERLGFSLVGGLMGIVCGVALVVLADRARERRVTPGAA